MAVVSVAFDGTRWTDAESLTPTTPYAGNWYDTAGAAAVLEPDFIYQGTYSISEKVKGTELGIGWVPTAALNMSTTKRVLILKTLITTVGILSSTTGSGANIEVGSGGRRSAYYKYYRYYGNTYPSNSSWIITAVDPNLSGYASTTTGSPSASAINWVAWMSTMTATTAKSENCAMDAIDYITHGTGLTLTGGSSTDADGTFQHFATYDAETSSNRYGICTTKEGVFYIVGMLTIGSSTETDFTDSNQTVIFPHNYVDTGFNGITIGLQNASSVISLTSITLVGKGYAAADGANADTRPDWVTTGTSGTLTIDACSFNNFRAITFTSTSTITDTSFNRCLSITPAQGTLDNCVIEASPVATNAACVTAADITDITNCSFISGGTGHALVISSTTGTPFTFTGNTFSGYGGTPGSNLVANSGSGDAAIYNNSGGDITINIVDGDVPSIRNGLGATTTVSSNITLTATVQDAAANPIIGAQVAVFKNSDDSALISSTPTNASGIVTASVPASSGAIFIRVRQSTNTGSFNTNTGVDSGTETITITAHSFVDGEKVVYRKNGGTASINASLVEGFTCYVNSTGANTVQLYDTAANAIAGTATGRYDLTSTTSETHSLDPIRYYPNSTVGTIGTTAFNVTITMIEDTTVTG